MIFNKSKLIIFPLALSGIAVYGLIGILEVEVTPDLTSSQRKTVKPTQQRKDPATSRLSFARTATHTDDYFEIWIDAISTSANAEDLALAAFFEFKRNRALGEELLLTAFSGDPSNLFVNYQILRLCLLDDKLSICSLPYIDTLLSVDPQNGYIHLVHANNLYKNGDLSAALVALAASSETTLADSYYWNILKVTDESFQRLNVERTVSNAFFTFELSASALTSVYPLLTNICSQDIRNNISRWSDSCYNAASHFGAKSETAIGRWSGETLAFSFSNLNSSELKAEKARREAHHKKNTDSLRVSALKLKELTVGAGSAALISDEVWTAFITLWKDEGEWSALAYYHDSLISQLIENEAS